MGDLAQYLTLTQGLRFRVSGSGDTLRLIAGDYGVINGYQIPNETAERHTKIVGAGMRGGSKILIPTDEHGNSFYGTNAYIEISDLEIDGQNGAGRNAINIDSVSSSS